MTDGPRNQTEILPLMISRLFHFLSPRLGMESRSVKHYLTYMTYQ